MTLRHNPDNAPPRDTIETLRARVIVGRIESTRPESVDHLLSLADLALSNDVVVSR